MTDNQRALILRQECIGHEFLTDEESFLDTSNVLCNVFVEWELDGSSPSDILDNLLILHNLPLNPCGSPDNVLAVTNDPGKTYHVSLVDCVVPIVEDDNTNSDHPSDDSDTLLPLVVTEPTAQNGVPMYDHFIPVFPTPSEFRFVLSPSKTPLFQFVVDVSAVVEYYRNTTTKQQQMNQTEAYPETEPALEQTRPSCTNNNNNNKTPSPSMQVLLQRELDETNAILVVLGIVAAFLLACLFWTVFCMHQKLKKKTDVDTKIGWSVGGVEAGPVSPLTRGMPTPAAQRYSEGPSAGVPHHVDLTANNQASIDDGIDDESHVTGPVVLFPPNTIRDEEDDCSHATGPLPFRPTSF